MLSYLMHQRGRVVSQGELAEHIYALDADRDSNTVEVFVARLREQAGRRRDRDRARPRLPHGGRVRAAASLHARLVAGAVLWTTASSSPPAPSVTVIILHVPDCGAAVHRASCTRCRPSCSAHALGPSQ